MQVDPPAGKTDAALSYDLAGEFAAAMSAMAVPSGRRIAVAVSGGADSMALAVLLAGWARAHRCDLHALTVDHGLRAAGADEARQVAAWMAPLGIAHTILRWEDGPRYRERPASAQAAAREARYALMGEWCAGRDVTDLFLAHHADDQAETFLQRLARGSGVDGLGAMAPVAERGALRLLRPLLAVPKSRLVSFCEEIGQPWVEDPSNSDAAYGRGRLRAARAVLEREGLSTERLVATAAHLRRARAALDHTVRERLAARCAWDRFGVGRCEAEAILAPPEEIGLRALARLLMVASGQGYRPRFERLVRLRDGLRADPMLTATLHGCVIRRAGALVVVQREPSAIGEEQVLRHATTVRWDGRFTVSVVGLAAGSELRLRRLSDRDVSEALRALPAWAGVPAAARMSLPALFDSNGLAAVPSLDFIRADLTTAPGVTVEARFAALETEHLDEPDAEL